MSQTPATKKKIGRVIGDKMDKTVTIIVERQKSHPIYLKKFQISKKIKAHDEENKYKVNDIVEIEEFKPISKTKSWRVVRKIS